MTPRELQAKAEGQRRKMKMEAVAAGAGYAGRLDIIDDFFDGSAPEMTLDDYEALKAELLPSPTAGSVTPPHAASASVLE